MLVVNPELPEPIRTFAQSVVDAIRALQTPQGPTPVFSISSDDLPPASDWPSCVVRVSNLDVLAVSNGSAWIRQDTGAAI